MPSVSFRGSAPNGFRQSDEHGRAYYLDNLSRETGTARFETLFRHVVQQGA